jgi:ATPase subunit of ABC transporter with duplicated ATPase domains
VRALSKELKINPNTAHKIVAHLVSEGLLETRPGIGTVVAALPDSTRKERTQLLGHEIEELVVEAKRLGIGREEMLASIAEHWQRLSKDPSSKDSQAQASPQRKDAENDESDEPDDPIQTESLSKSFGRTEVLRGIDLAVPEGAIYALVGANGAGKTTMIKLLMNILRPTAGRAQVLGVDSRKTGGQRTSTASATSPKIRTCRTR